MTSEEPVLPPPPPIGTAAAPHGPLQSTVDPLAQQEQPETENGKHVEEEGKEAEGETGKKQDEDGDGGTRQDKEGMLYGALSLPALGLTDVAAVDPEDEKFAEGSCKLYKRHRWTTLEFGIKGKCVTHVQAWCVSLSYSFVMFTYGNVGKGGTGYQVTAKLLLSLGWPVGNEGKYVFVSSGDQVHYCLVDRIVCRSYIRTCLVR